MMIIYDEDEWVFDYCSHMCEHHKRQPWDDSYPGCTCSGGMWQRRATPEEKIANIKRRDEENERRRKHMADYGAGKIT